MERLTADIEGPEDEDMFKACEDGKYRCKTGCYKVVPDGKRCLMPDIYRRLAEYEDTGLTPDEVAELAAAKAGGREIKVGDIFYEIFYDESEGHPVIADDCCFGSPGFLVLHNGNEQGFVPASAIGNTVFLTRADAEAALAAQKGEAK